MESDTKLGPEVLAELERLEKAATPGPWDTYVEQTPLPSDVYRELREQARHNVTDGSFTGTLVMLTDGKRAPAITGCGPTSLPNAAFIAALRNAAPALIAAARRLGAANARVAELTQRAEAAEAVLRRIADVKDMSEGPNMSGRLAVRAALFQRFAREHLATLAAAKAADAIERGDHEKEKTDG